MLKSQQAVQLEKKIGKQAYAHFEQKQRFFKFLSF